MFISNQIPTNYPQPQPNKYFPCLNKTPEKFNKKMSTKDNPPPLSSSLSELFHAATLYFTILFFTPSASYLLIFPNLFRFKTMNCITSAERWTTFRCHRFLFGPDSIAYIIWENKEYRKIPIHPN